LPPQRHPLPGFLTLSAACSRCTLVALFHATSTHRLCGPSELFPPQSAAMSLDIDLLSCHQVPHHAHRTSRLRVRRPMHSTWQARWRVLGAARDPGSRALLRPGVRHSARRINVEQSRCSPGLLPLRGLPTRPLGANPPLVYLSVRDLRRSAHGRYYRVSIRSSLGVAPERATSASMRFFTSYDRARMSSEESFQIDRNSTPRQTPQAARHQGVCFAVTVRFRC